MIGWVLPINGIFIHPVRCWVKGGSVVVVEQGWSASRTSFICIDTEAELVALLLQGHRLVRKDPAFIAGMDPVRRHYG